MEEISTISRLFKNFPPINTHLVEYLGYDRMTEYGYNLLLETEAGEDRVNLHTKKP